MNKLVHDSETPAHGKQVISACALIHHNFDGVDKIFMPKRAATKKFLPNVFEIPGGHIDYGEDIVEGLKREVLEETGMHISVGDPFAVFTYINEIKGSHSVEAVYFARFSDPLEQITLNPDDHSEYRWIAEADLSDPELRSDNVSDVELNNVRKGLELLRGTAHNFG